MGSPNALAVTVSIATVMNAADLVYNTMNDLAGESLSGVIDGTDLMTDFGYELIAAKFGAELSLYAEGN